MDYVDFWFLNGAEAGPLTYQFGAKPAEPSPDQACLEKKVLPRWRCKMCVDFLGRGLGNDLHNIKATPSTVVAATAVSITKATRQMSWSWTGPTSHGAWGNLKH